MGDQKEDDVKGDSEACVWANVTCSEIKDSRNVCLSLVREGLCLITVKYHSTI